MKHKENLQAVKESFVRDLHSKPLDLVASIWILDRVPHIFDDDRLAYASWRRELAAGLEVDPSALLIVGSSVLGFSLAPNNNLQDFDENSDIDVAVVSDYHFLQAWRALRNIKSELHAYDEHTKIAIEDHRTRLIYWGTIATDKILTALPFSQKWRDSMQKMSGLVPTKGRALKARIYRDLDSLRAYQVEGIRKIRNRIALKERK